MRRLLQVFYALVVVIVVAVVALRLRPISDPPRPSSAEPGAAQHASLTRVAVPDVPRPPDADRYSERPGPEKFLGDDSLSKALVEELSARYQPALADFRRAAGEAGARLAVVSFGTEGGKHATPLERRAQPVIAAACKALGIPYYDFAAAMDSAIDAGAKVVIDPPDSHVSRAGAAVVAAQMADIIRANSDYRSPKTFSRDERPLTFGDFRPREDDVVDLANGHPYMLKVNSQGLRMDYDLEFPKKKQRILLLGSSLAYFPFLDNDKTATGVLQATLPDREILNGAMLAFGIHEELDLFIDKAAYAEPDIVILQQSGMDVLRSFFTMRNFMDRAKHYHPPTPLEKAWYDARYPAK